MRISAPLPFVLNSLPPHSEGSPPRTKRSSAFATEPPRPKGILRQQYCLFSHQLTNCVIWSRGSKRPPQFAKEAIEASVMEVSSLHEPAGMMAAHLVLGWSGVSQPTMSLIPSARTSARYLHSMHFIR